MTLNSYKHVINCCTASKCICCIKCSSFWLICLVLSIVGLCNSFAGLTYAQSDSSGSPINANDLLLYEDPARGYQIKYPSDANLEEVAAGTHFSKPEWSFGVLVSDHDGRDLNQVVQEIADFERELGFNIIDSSKKLHVAGEPAQMITKEEGQEKRWNIFMIKDNKLFEFQVTAPLQTFSSYSDLFFIMLNSFEFIN